MSLAAVLTAVGIFLATASFSRSETASGLIIPEGGMLNVVPVIAGRVEEVPVKEGQFVTRGTTLARIRSEAINSVGEGTATALLSAIDEQKRRLAEQQALSRFASTSEQYEFDDRIAGIRQELTSIDAQVMVQRRLLDMARSDVQQIRKIADRGFVSRRDMNGREETALLREQQLAALSQTRAAKLSDMRQAIKARGQAAANGSKAASALDSTTVQLDRERFGVLADQGYSLTAPSDGQVAALNLVPGDAVTPGSPAMIILPRGGNLIARLFIPGKAAGSVRVGQAVQIAVDAYPRDRFGTVLGRITTLASAPVTRTENGESAAYYIATVSMEDPVIHAYGTRHRLIAGMTLSAGILTDRRSLFSWLFDPLLAAVRW